MINRKELVLATLAAADGARFTPVQLQKAIFLLDRNLPADLLDTKFGFVPYDYGPFGLLKLRSLQEGVGKPTQLRAKE